MLLLSTGKREN